MPLGFVSVVFLPVFKVHHKQWNSQKTNKHYSLKSVKWVNNVVGNNLNCFAWAMYDK